MTSTSFHETGTGFMKCMPITFPGRLVMAAILVMEMDDVLVARMQMCGCANIHLFEYLQFQVDIFPWRLLQPGRPV